MNAFAYAFAIFAFILASAMVSASPADSIAAYFRLDEGSGAFTNDTINPIPFNQGNLTATPAWIPGKIGYGLGFTGASSQYVLLGNNSNYNYVWNFSISFWFNATNTSTGYFVARDSGAADSNSKYRMSVGSAGCTDKMLCWQVSTTAAFNNYADTITDNPGDGRWHMLTGTTNATHLSLYLDGVLKSIAPMAAGTPAGGNTQTRLGGRTNGVYYTGGLDEVGFWNRTLAPSEIAQIYNSGNGISYPFIPLMGLNIYSPANGSNIYSLNATSVSIPVTLNTTGALYCYYNSTLGAGDTYFPCGSDNTAVTINYLNAFGINTLRFFANDSTGAAYVNQTTVKMHRYVFDNATYETDSARISLELWNQTAAPTQAKLEYNNTNSTAEITHVSNGMYTLNATIDVPSGISSASFRYYYNNGAFTATTARTQYVNPINFTICSGSSGVPYLNITFRNETTLQERLNASLAASTFMYWLGSGTVNKTYSISSTTINRNYTFCFTPSDRTLTASESVSYYNADSPQRTFTGLLSLTNATTQQVLYLLPTSIGSYVTFQVVNPAQQPLVGVVINITSSTFGTIETRTTDASGSATFFLNPLSTYSVLVSKSGYSSSTSSITPTQSQYTITLTSGSDTSSVVDNFKGITYEILPSGTYLLNQTDYPFNFTLNSAYWSFDSFGFTIKDANGTLLSSQSSTSQGGGRVSDTLNTGENSTLILNAFWEIDGNFTNVTKIYIIFDGSGSDTSLANLRDRIRTYLTTGDGIFGLTGFGMNLIVFLVIFGTTGAISYKYGISSPAAVLGIMFVMCALFDYMNLITYASSLPEDSASFVTFLFAFGYAIKEAMT